MVEDSGDDYDSDSWGKEELTIPSQEQRKEQAKEGSATTATDEGADDWLLPTKAPDPAPKKAATKTEEPTKPSHDDAKADDDRPMMLVDMTRMNDRRNFVKPFRNLECIAIRKVEVRNN